LFQAVDDAREGLGRLVERLQARLGRDRVGRLRQLPDHRPERAWRIVPIETLSAPRAAGRAADARGGLPRPLWLLRAPLPLAERDHRPWFHGPLSLVAGPERIEGGWWDLHLVQRDYFVAQDEASALYWVFRARGTDAAPPSWFLHGCFG
jgi:protein ImuB